MGIILKSVSTRPGTDHFDGKSVGYDSYFIGWDKRGHEVREPDTGHGKLAIMDFRKVFEEPLYVIETEAEFLSWQWKWGSFAANVINFGNYP